MKLGKTPAKSIVGLLVVIIIGFGITLFAAPAVAPTKAAELLQTTKIWTIHLKWTAAEWEAMEPKGGQRGPGGPGGRGGGFGPAMMLAPGFLKADQDKDGKISKEEFSKLGSDWFTTWDSKQTGSLSAADVTDGINKSFQMQMPGGPGGPGGGPGGPGGPGGGPGGPGGRGGNPNGGMQGANGRNGASAMSGIDFQYVHADLDFDGTQLKDIAIRYKGNSTFMMSRGSDKRSLKLDLSKFTKGQKFAGLTKINLHSCATDDGYLNEVLSYGLFRDAKVPSPRTAYARVYITVPGKHQDKYLGLYSVVEDIDETFAEEHFGQSKGAIFKPSTRNLFFDLGDDWEKYNQIYDPKTKLTKKQQRRVIDFAKFVTKATDEDFAKGLADYLDIEEFARFLSTTVWLSNSDSILAMGQNFYIYLHPETNKFLFLPWDLDLSFGKFGGSNAELSINKPWQGQNKFLERVFKVDAFKKSYVDLLAKNNNTIFAPERIIKKLEETAAILRPAVKDESEAKLKRFDKSIAGESSPGGFGPPPPPQPPPGGPSPVAPGSPGVAGGPGGGRGGFGGPGGPMGGKPIKAFAGPRAKSVADQLAGKSEGTANGGFGGPGGGRGGPGGFGPGMLLGPTFVTAMDSNKDGKVSDKEFKDAFNKWFDSWSKDGVLTEAQLRAGIEKDLAPAGMPGPPPF